MCLIIGYTVNDPKVFLKVFLKINGGLKSFNDESISIVLDIFYSADLMSQSTQSDFHKEF